MSDVITYIPSLTKVSLFGILLGDFSPEDIVRIERVEGATRSRKAQDGSRVLVLDKYGTYRVTVTLFQNSSTNTWLHLIYKLYQAMANNLAMPLDVSYAGRSTFTSTDVYFEDEPTVNYTSGVEVMVWTFICHNGSYNITGLGDNNEYVLKLQSLVRAIELLSGIFPDMNGLVSMTEKMIKTTSKNLFGMFL